jgi:hypothetical protein
MSVDDGRVRLSTQSPFQEWKQRENAKERYFRERAVSELRVLQARHAQLLMQLQKEHAQAVKKQEEYALSMTFMTGMVNQLQPRGAWCSQVRELQTRIRVDRQADAAKLQTYGEQLVERTGTSLSYVPWRSAKLTRAEYCFFARLCISRTGFPMTWTRKVSVRSMIQTPGSLSASNCLVLEQILISCR